MSENNMAHGSNFRVFSCDVAPSVVPSQDSSPLQDLSSHVYPSGNSKLGDVFSFSNLKWKLEYRSKSDG